MILVFGFLSGGKVSKISVCYKYSKTKNKDGDAKIFQIDLTQYFLNSCSYPFLSHGSI